MEFEMNFVQVLKECEQANGAGSKDVIKLALAKLDGASRQLMLYMQDPFMVFGVKKFDRPTAYATEDTTDIKHVLSILDLLRTRQLTGNLARQAVTDMLSAFTADSANYIERILDKDPRAGFSAATYNVVILAKEKAKHENIDFLTACKLVDKQIKKDGIEEPFAHYVSYSDVVPTFVVQLADKCDSTEDFESKVTFPCQADYKYDGCLSKEWKITLEDGRIVTIGEFVDNNLSGNVLSYNITTQKKEWKKIITSIKNSMPERQYEWFRITLEDGIVLPPLTGNHRVWLPKLKCWRRVDELEVSDVLLKN